jgi:dTDP-4-dehydrorhamnose reductase
MQPKHSLAEWFLEGFLKGDVRSGFIDVRISPLLVNDLVDWILKLMDEQQQGVFHLSSQDCMSKFEFGKLIAAMYGLNESLCRPVKVEEAGLKARRPKNLCLDSWKANTVLRMQPCQVSEGIARFKSLGDRNYPNALKECLV